MSMARAVQLLTAQPMRTGAGKKMRELPPPSKAEATFALTYMETFGYLPLALAGWQDIRIEDIVRAIGLFQSWFGLKKTLQLDPATVKSMEWPRCGHADVVRPHHTEALAVQAFVAANLPRWTKDGLTYKFATFVPGLTADVQRRLTAQAFEAWTQWTNLNVRETRGGSADIILSTGQGARANFDGPGGTLAWAYLPDGSDRQLEMRFDLGETWTDTPTARGIMYLNVATHEYGHLLGLDHSKVASAVMAPYYNPAVAAPQQNDDVARIQKLYGVRASAAKPKRPRVVIDGDVEVLVNGRLVT